MFVAWFPVAFQSKVDGAPFRIASLFVLFYIFTPHIDGPAAALAKYLLSIVLMLCFALLALTRGINLWPRFPLAPLLLSLIGCASLTYSIFIAPGTTTFSSALIPLVLSAIPLLIATRATRTNGSAVTEYLLGIFGLAALFHVFWQAVAKLLGWEENDIFYGSFGVPWHAGSFTLIYFMILSGMFKRRMLFGLSIAFIAASLVLRPGSTMAFGALLATATIMLHRLHFGRFSRPALIFVTVAIIVGNFAILESDDLARSIYASEPLVKQGVLDAHSNNEFRLGIIRAARDELAKRSLWVGNGFAGNVDVDPLVYLPWLQEDDQEVIIHSDFVSIIVQGGLLGYALIASLFIGMALLCARAARLANAVGDGGNETLFDALLTMNATFMIYISPNPTMQSTQYLLPYLILLPIAIFLARAQPGFSHTRPDVRLR